MNDPVRIRDIMERVSVKNAELEFVIRESEKEPGKRYYALQMDGREWGWAGWTVDPKTNTEIDPSVSSLNWSLKTALKKAGNGPYTAPRKPREVGDRYKDTKPVVQPVAREETPDLMKRINDLEIGQEVIFNKLKETNLLLQRLLNHVESYN